nr:hypothetical protein [Salmonella enterica]
MARRSASVLHSPSARLQNTAIRGYCDSRVKKTVLFRRVSVHD